MSEHQKELDRHFAWFENKLPSRPAKFVGWLRKPSSIYARKHARHAADRRRRVQLSADTRRLMPFPSDFLLFAQDVPPLQKPMAHGLGWIERKWLERERIKQERERAKN